MTGEGLQRYARKLPMFLSRLNEISGSFEKILPVSLLFWSNLKFFKMWLRGCVDVKKYFCKGKPISARPTGN